MNANAADLFEELGNGVVRPVYLLLGEDQGAKEEFLAGLRAALFGRPADGREDPGRPGAGHGDAAHSGAGHGDAAHEDVVVFHGDEAGVGQVLEALSTFSFFPGGKLVIVRGCDKLSGLKQIADHLERSGGGPDAGGPPGEVLALLSDRKNVDRSLESAVEKKGRSCIFWPMFESQGERWVLRKLRERGIRTDGETLKYVVDVTGTTVSDLANQVETISNLLDGGGDLDLETATRALSRIYRCTVFDLAASLFVKSPLELLAVFRQLLANGEDLLKMSYFVGREVRKILGARALKESGHRFPDAARMLGLKKMEAARIGPIVERVSVSFLRSVAAGLFTLDHLIKTSPREICLLHFERLLLGLGRKGV
jgi:DNA polymerase III delta subunit